MKPPVILEKGMKPVKFVKGDYEVTFPTKALDKLFIAARVAELVRVELPITVYVRDKVAQKVSFPDFRKFIIIETDLPGNIALNTPEWFARTETELRILRSGAYNPIICKVDVDLAVKYLQKSLGVMKEYKTRFKFLEAKKFRVVTAKTVAALLKTKDPFSISRLVDALKDSTGIYSDYVEGKSVPCIKIQNKGITEKEWEIYKRIRLSGPLEAKSFTKDGREAVILYLRALHESNKAWKKVGSCFEETYPSPPYSSEQWDGFVSLHTHPVQYPSPPSAIHGEYGDIQFLLGSKNPTGNLLYRGKHKWELILYYEPDKRNKKAYVDLFVEFWHRDKEKAAQMMRELAMQPQEVKA